MIIHGKKLKMLTKRDDPGITPQSFYNSQLPDDYDSTVCYHTKCYKDFTAVPKQPSTNSENQGLKQRLLRVNVEHPTTSSSGVYDLNVFSAIKLQNLPVRINMNILLVL